MTAFYHTNGNNRLTQRDLQKLAESWITPELAEQAGLFRVDNHEGATLIGRSPSSGNYAGMVFPNVFPGQLRAREYRIRRDQPEIEYKDGTPKEKAKYLGPPGRGNMLYFVPGTDLNALSDPAITIVITEGEKKALALFRLALETRQYWLVIGLLGVWNWRGTIGKTEGPEGERRDVKGVIADLDLINWQGIIVKIVFDANVLTNASVAAARRELARELVKRGASVQFVNIPAEAGVNGVDDLIPVWGPVRALNLFEQAIPAEQDGKDDRTQAEILVRLADKATLFQTPEKNFYAAVIKDGHTETLSLTERGSDFRHWLVDQFCLAQDTVPQPSAIATAISVLTARARFGGKICEIYTRLAAGTEGNIYLDLANDQWEAVEITAHGWQIRKDPPVRFRRVRGQRALPYPARGGGIEELRPYLHVASERDWKMLVAWSVAALRPHGPYPVLILHGERGSAKSTTTRYLCLLIDPTKPVTRDAPKEPRNLAIAARTNYVLAFDNLSVVPPWLSDALCRLSTGAGFATRSLYTDDEEAIFENAIPVIINSIEEVATRGDLLDRALIVSLPPIAPDARLSEQDLDRQFVADAPRILGALLDVVSAALARLPHIKLRELPRMADFALWICAAEEALGWEDGSFLQAYAENRKEAVSMELEASPIGSPILAFVQERGEWCGKASILLEEITRRVDEEVTKRKSWPGDAIRLSGALKRIAPALRAHGVNVGFEKSNGKRSIKLISCDRT